MRLPILVKVYQDGEIWVAHAIELDIVAMGATKEEAMSSLGDLVRAHVAFALEHGNLGAVFKPFYSWN